jgi:signal transduction histidine kinase
LLKDCERAKPEDLEGRLAFVADGARRIDLLVDGLATYAIALQTDAASFQSTRLDVLLRSALARIEKLLRETGAEVTYDEMPLVRGNPDRLMQLFEHLLRNAIVHRGESTAQVHISATRPVEGEWKITVQDNGPGVEASEVERIFRPFERLRGHGATGPGMGLAICRAIVEAHGGRIWAEPGEGFTVVFTIPA